jgi:DNA topoisomerase-1
MSYINFITNLQYNYLNMNGGSKKDWINNFNSLYEKSTNTTSFNFANSRHIIPPLHRQYQRDMAFDDKMKKKKKGIYREKYEDKNDLDKKGNPKIKFKYYYLSDNREVSNEEQLRINKLGLAPAYEDVWVSDDPTSKIQATGMDIKGRKQYRYTQIHVADAGTEKFLRLYKFIKVIHKLNDAMDKDIKSELYSKNRTISIMLNIVKELNIRVGKECYAKTNKSYGISSMKKSHLKIDENKLIAKFNFKAKSNKQVQYTLNNKEIVKELILLMKLEGEKLFQYITPSNDIMKVSDVDLNQYIQNNIGKEFSCKDFRTYAANFYFVKALLKETKNRNPTDQKTAKKNLSLAQENTAYYLRHTKSISKKSYTMDLIRDTYINNPDYFIQNKNKQPLTVLIELLKMFKDKIKSNK